MEAKHPGINRKHNLKSKYGITPEDYDRMLAEQGGRCKVCMTDEPGSRGIFVVDHCHETGKNRGLLCSKCNTAIGQLGDDVTMLERAIMYLKGEL